MEKIKAPSKKTTLIAIGVVLILVILGLALFSRTQKARGYYYSYKARSAVASENEAIGQPFNALGFSDIRTKKPVCGPQLKYGQPDEPYTCTATINGYHVFKTDASKTTAKAAAKDLPKLLAQNGWKNGRSEVSQWFDEVLNNVDYNPDSFMYKYTAETKTLCILDFRVAYRVPQPPAVGGEITCSTPEAKDPFNFKN